MKEKTNNLNKIEYETSKLDADLKEMMNVEYAKGLEKIFSNALDLFEW